MRNADICLVSSPKRSNAQIIPISLIYLAAWLEKEGLSADIIDVKINPYETLDNTKEKEIIKKIIYKIIERKPRFVGISCFSSEYNSVMRLAQEVKRHTGVNVIIGGVHPTLRPEDFIYEKSPVDFVVIGEGEETISELLKHGADPAYLKNIKGISFLEGDDIYLTPPRPLIENLSKLPLPSYDKLDMDYYLKMTRSVIRYLYTSGVHILTSRGCPFNCTFCAAKNLWRSPGSKTRVRYKEVGQIVDEIQCLKNKYQIDSFYIADDTFAISKKRAMEFCEELISRGIDIIWAMETRVNLVNDELLKTAKKAGCIQVEFGVESGSQEALDRMKKDIKIEDIIKAFELCRKHGMRTFANLMLNTPGETEEDVKGTFTLKKKIRASHTGVNLTMPIMGTDIYEKYVQPKMTREEYYLFEDPHLYTRILDPRFRLANHKLDLDRLYYKANFYNYLNSFIEFTFNPRYLKSIVRSRRKREIPSVVILSFWKQVRAYIGFFRNAALRIFRIR